MVHILVIDDEAVLLDLISNTLRLNGHDVSALGDPPRGAGALARALARSEAPASASSRGTRASRAVQGDRPTKRVPERLP